MHSAKLEDMENRKKCNNERLAALAKVYEQRNGFMSDLVQEIGQKFVDEFIAVGFIICGYTIAAKTWRISELGKEFYTEIK